LAALAMNLRGNLDTTTSLNSSGLLNSTGTSENRPEIQGFASRLRERLLAATKGNHVEQATMQMELDLRESLKQAGMIPIDHETVSEFTGKLPKLLQSAFPALLECGGQQRRILLVADAEQQKLLEPLVRNAVKSEIAVRIVPGVQPTFVHEAQGIAISQAVPRLVTALGADHQLVGRLQARADLVL
jgi:hypothetical protein